MAVEGLWEDQMQGRGKGRGRVTGGRQWGAVAKTGKVACEGTTENRWSDQHAPVCSGLAWFQLCVPGNPSVLGRPVGGLGRGRV